VDGAAWTRAKSAGEIGGPGDQLDARTPMKAVTQVVSMLSRVPGVVAAMVVGAADGLIVETSAMMGATEGPATRNHTAALAAYLYSKVTRASSAASLGTPSFMRLEAE